jgi:hypothetical protein
LDGDQKARIVVFRDEDSFDSIQTPSPNPDAASDINKWMRKERKTIGKHSLYRFDLAVGNGNTSATPANKLCYPVCSQDGHACAGCLGDSHKDVMREQGRVNYASPIAPLMLLSE